MEDKILKQLMKKISAPESPRDLCSRLFAVELILSSDVFFITTRRIFEEELTPKERYQFFEYFSGHEELSMIMGCFEVYTYTISRMKGDYIFAFGRAIKKESWFWYGLILLYLLGFGLAYFFMRGWSSLKTSILVAIVLQLRTKFVLERQLRTIVRQCDTISRIKWNEGSKKKHEEELIQALKEVEWYKKD